MRNACVTRENLPGMVKPSSLGFLLVSTAAARTTALSAAFAHSLLPVHTSENAQHVDLGASMAAGCRPLSSPIDTGIL